MHISSALEPLMILNVDAGKLLIMSKMAFVRVIFTLGMNR